MVFKLIRIDISDPCKVELPQGTHDLGRGNFLKSLECDDKRVSRKHGRLDVTKDSVVLTALNRNPCFYLKKNAESHILHFESSIDLTNGDSFGLLPSSYWYELILCADDMESEDNHTISNVNAPIQVNNDIAPEQDIQTAENTNTIDPQTPSTIKRNHSHAQSNDNVKIKEEGETCGKVMIKEEGETSAKVKVKEEGGTCSKVEVKKEGDKVKVKEEIINGQPGTSRNNNADNINNNGQNVPPPPDKPPNDAPIRERCWYGAQCYRKKPSHKVDFSHPSDPDWGPDNRPCLYGASCKKGDPRHWRDYRHPQPGPPPAVPHRPPDGKRKKKIVCESEDDDFSSGETDVLPAKRVRKPIHSISYSDDDDHSEKDPYATDQDSDEWVPSNTQGRDSSQDYSLTQDF